MTTIVKTTVPDLRLEDVTTASRCFHQQEFQKTKCQSEKLSFVLFINMHISEKKYETRNSVMTI